MASLPTFLILRERARPSAGRADLAGALAQVRQTIRDATRYADLRRFLVCLVFYQAGIQAVIALAAVYAQEVMGFTTRIRWCLF